MNRVCLSGTLARDAVVFGKEKRVMKFTLEVARRTAGESPITVTNYVPCAVFEPEPALERRLVENGKGRRVSCEGRVVQSSFEVDGERRYSTEVVVNPQTLSVFGEGSGQ